MKTVMMMALLFLAGAEARAELTCVNDLGLGQPKVEFRKEQNGDYSISVYGNSRNTYSATYRNPAPFPRPVFGQKLVKVEDHSTHQDMPENLTLNYFGVSHTDIGFTYTLLGLIPKGSVEFNEFKHCAVDEAQL